MSTPSIVFQQRGHVIEAAPVGATIRIELLPGSHASDDRAHVRLSLDELPPISLTVNPSPAYSLVDEACSIAAALYWSRRRAIAHGPQTWTLVVHES